MSRCHGVIGNGTVNTKNVFGFKDPDTVRSCEAARLRDRIRLVLVK